MNCFCSTPVHSTLVARPDTGTGNRTSLCDYEITFVIIYSESMDSQQQQRPDEEGWLAGQKSPRDVRVYTSRRRLSIGDKYKNITRLNKICWFWTETCFCPLNWFLNALSRMQRIETSIPACLPVHGIYHKNNNNNNKYLSPEQTTRCT